MIEPSRALLHTSSCGVYVYMCSCWGNGFAAVLLPSTLVGGHKHNHCPTPKRAPTHDILLCQWRSTHGHWCVKRSALPTFFLRASLFSVCDPSQNSPNIGFSNLLLFPLPIGRDLIARLTSLSEPFRFAVPQPLSMWVMCTLFWKKCCSPNS